MKDYGFPECGQICRRNKPGGGEVVLCRVDTSGKTTFYDPLICDENGYMGCAWGSQIWPVDKSPAHWPGSGFTPEPAWGRKGPIVPPVVGMVIEVPSAKWTIEITRAHDDGRTEGVIDSSVYTAWTGTAYFWGSEQMRIKSLPPGYVYRPSAAAADDMPVINFRAVSYPKPAQCGWCQGANEWDAEANRPGGKFMCAMCRIQHS